MTKFVPLIAATALLAGCGSNGSGASGEQIKIVGSSTVYPFTKAVAEEFEMYKAELARHKAAA